DARHSGALQRPVRRAARGSRGALSGGRRADHGPPGPGAEDVDHRKQRAGHGVRPRRARCDPQEVPLVGDRLRTGGRSRPGQSPGDGRPDAARGARGDGVPSDPRRPVASGPMRLAELELDLDVFAGPFDLLLTLILREEVDLLEVDLAEIVISYIDHLDRRGELDLEAATEFLVLIAALLELKSRLLLPGEEQ